jgi:hypothetical protein
VGYLQAEAGTSTTTPRGKERVEDLGKSILGNASAVIRYHELAIVFLGGKRYLYTPGRTLIEGVNLCIGDEIGDNLSEYTRIAEQAEILRALDLEIKRRSLASRLGGGTDHK